MVLFSCDTYEPEKLSAWQDIPKGIVVALNGGYQQQLSNWTRDFINRKEFMMVL